MVPMWEEKIFFDAPIFVQYDCTNACNFRCRHCITSSGEKLKNELSTEEAIKLIRELGRLHVFQIGFSGGEALARSDIFTLMEEAKKSKLKIQLTTNAALITKEKAKKLKELDPVTIGVSMEGGEKASYEKFRGKGNFIKAVEGIKTLLEYELPVKVKTAVSRENINEIERIINLAKKLGIDSIDMFLFYPAGRGEKMKNSMLSRSEIKEFLEKLNILRKKFRGAVNIDVEDKPNAFLIDRELSHATCGAGAYWAEVLPNGDVAPCIFLKDLCAGNVREKSFKKIWESTLWEPLRDRRFLKGRCSKCEHRYSCGGGCRANAYLMLGDIKQEDALCWYGIE